MKFEISSKSKKEIIRTHVIKDFELTDFQGWTGLDDEIPLTELLGIVDNLQPADQELPATNLSVEPFLPSPAKEKLNIDDQNLLQPKINLVDAMMTITQAVLYNYQPNEEYYVRILE